MEGKNREAARGQGRAGRVFAKAALGPNFSGNNFNGCCTKALYLPTLVATLISAFLYQLTRALAPFFIFRGCELARRKLDSFAEN